MEVIIDPKKALIKNRVAIVRDLDNGDEVADQLFTVGLFTDEMKDTVMQEPEKEKKNRYILDTLNRRGKKATKGLYEAFLDTQNKELAELLAPYIRAQDSEENRFSPSIWPPLEIEQQKMEKDHVKTIKDLKSPVYYHEYLSDKVYKMRNKERGKVFMINNENFTKESRLNDRPGSDVDKNNIESLFKELQFDVVSKNNLTGKAMVEFLTIERDKVNWNDMDCLVLVIMSHGHTTGVFGIDRDEVPLKRMTDLFTSSNCPGLNEKPRLVFVQACRGENTEVGMTGTGIQVTQDGEQSDANGVGNIHPTDQTDAIASRENETHIQTAHSSSDFLIAYATPEGTPAYRNINVGSWFLNAVVWTFKYHADELEIQHLMLRVNELVSKGRTMKGNLTVSEIKNSLRKKFYFFPGVYDNPPKLLGSFN